MTRPSLLVALALLVAAASCATIAGLDGDFSVGASGDGGTIGGGGTAGSAAGGTAGAGGSTSTGTGSGTSTGVGGSTPTGTGGSTGSGGAGGDDSDLDAMRSALDGLRVEHLCQNDGDDFCDTTGVVSDVATGAGDSNTDYEVDILVRGIVELTTYQNGTAQGHLYIGGQPDATWNTYGLRVNDPPAHYYFNGNSCCDAWLTELNITTTIVVNGNGTVRLEGDDINDVSTVNQNQSGQPIVVNGVPPAPNPFNGQFVQVNVTDVRRVP